MLISVRILLTEQLKHDCVYTGRVVVTVPLMVDTGRHGASGTLQVDGLANKSRVCCFFSAPENLLIQIAGDDKYFYCNFNTVLRLIYYLVGKIETT